MFIPDVLFSNFKIIYYQCIDLQRVWIFIIRKGCPTFKLKNKIVINDV